MHRRQFLGTTALVAGAGLLASLGFAARGRAVAAEGAFPVRKTPDEWRKVLTPDQFAVLREEATERPFTSPLNDNKQAGTYNCAGCGAALYRSAAKYDSGTGWPSFWQAAGTGAVATTTDYKLIYPRTEVHCAACGGHLGHIFDDGPPPTGKRHCINGVALRFEATPAASG